MRDIMSAKTTRALTFGLALSLGAIAFDAAPAAADGIGFGHVILLLCFASAHPTSCFANCNCPIWRELAY